MKVLDMRAVRKASSVLLFLFATLPVISAGTSLYTEQGKLIRAPKAMGVLGADLFGDQVNLYSGSLSFIQNDVTLPGNTALTVAMGRRWETAADRGGMTGAFGQWDMEIPHLHGMFSQSRGWSVVSTSSSSKRCSLFGAPPPVTSSNGGIGSWLASEYWHGNFLYVPGVGDQEMLRRDSNNLNFPTTPAPNLMVPNPYPVVTTKQWVFSCLPSLKYPATPTSGEGFLATAPNGDQYRFDWMVRRTATPLEKGSPAPVYTKSAAKAPVEDDTLMMTAESKSTEPPSPMINSEEMLQRDEVWILPTLVTDRFGNTVTYTYDPAAPWHLQSIAATSVLGTDLRKITLTYLPNTNLVSSVSDGTRTWTYNYAIPYVNGYLESVVLPDKSTWKFTAIAEMDATVNYAAAPSCTTSGELYDTPVTGTMTHPSGAVGEFTLTPTMHGRARVRQDCRKLVPTGEAYPNFPRHFSTMALTKKVITGPGLAPMQWSTLYPPAEASWESCTTCSVSKNVEVTDPSGNKTVHTFGTQFKVTEGQLQQTAIYNHDGTLLRTTAITYRDPALGPFPNPVGKSEQARGDGELGAKLQVTEQRITSQQGVNFTWKVTDIAGIDDMGRAKDVTRESTLPFKRREVTTFKDDKSKWILGQVLQVVEPSTGLVPVLNGYDPTSLMLTSVTNFGALAKTMTYAADGTLSTTKDARNPATTFSNYKMGIAQNVTYPDLSTESAFVNDIGLIDFTIDANGFKTSYKYDAGARLARVTYPTADSVLWNDTIITTAQSAVNEFGLPPGHWTQTVATGNAQTVTYLDALFRPVYTSTADLADVAGTARVVKHGYDAAGHTTFASYPQRTAAEIAAGVFTEYDGLGRVSKVMADSELGVLTSSFAYIDGFQKTATDPLLRSTTTGYQAFDEPVDTAIISIAAPLAVQVKIVRDQFGKPSSITRSGSGKTATRSYVYDQNARLCKTIEPETAATVQAYDAAGNVSWRATGLPLPLTDSCDTASVPAAKKMSFDYDQLNALKSTVYGDGSPGITRTYHPDGLPKTVTSNGTEWTYGYNKRRLNETEVLTYAGKAYALTKTFDANGSLASLKYPDNLAVAYAPNALGEAKQVGTYATGVTYYPSGAVKSFKYGNGIVHTLKQNLRGLPEISNDVGVINDTYAYDKVGNVKSITDSQGVSSRTMGYDDLDRLTSVVAPNMWGSAAYDYDALDNLTTSTVSAGTGTRTLVHQYDATNKLSAITGTAGFAFTYGYDGQGNITQRGAQSFAFDQGNRLKSAPGKATYIYDGLGRRMSVVGNDSVNRIQVYSQAGQLLFAGPVGGLATKYIYLRNHVIAEVAQ